MAQIPYLGGVLPEITRSFTAASMISERLTMTMTARVMGPTCNAPQLLGMMSAHQRLPEAEPSKSVQNSLPAPTLSSKKPTCLRRMNSERQ